MFLVSVALFISTDIHLIIDRISLEVLRCQFTSGSECLPQDRQFGTLTNRSWPAVDHGSHRATDSKR